MSADYSTPLYAQYKAVLRGNYSYRSDSYSDAESEYRRIAKFALMGGLSFSTWCGDGSAQCPGYSSKTTTDKVATTLRNYAEQSARHRELRISLDKERSGLRFSTRISERPPTNAMFGQSTRWTITAFLSPLALIAHGAALLNA